MVGLIPGSGRVTFNNQRSYLKAVTAAFVEIKTTKFTKKVSGAGGAAQGEVCVMGDTAGSTSAHGACPMFLLQQREVGLLLCQPQGCCWGWIWGTQAEGSQPGAAPCPLPGSPAGSD